MEKRTPLPTKPYVSPAIQRMEINMESNLLYSGQDVDSTSIDSFDSVDLFGDEI